MINGGATPARNYRSHLLHLERLLGLLHQARRVVDQVTVLSGDGSDPAPDLAVREARPDGLWLVEGTRLDAALRPPTVLENSTLAGAQLFPATRGALTIWSLTVGQRLTRGDTLLLYVTDHGARGETGRDDGRITLWGENQSLSVAELRDLLDTLDPGVRVVALMSQCYSGAFAGLADPDGKGDAGKARPVCGYFSTTADRPAYGCYPENLGRDNVGHSFAFLRALGSSGLFDEAHARTLVRDGTPDVPVRTSDIYLAGRIKRLATARGQEQTAFIDSLLNEAAAHPEFWGRERRLVDEVAHSFGLTNPPSLSALADDKAKVVAAAARLQTGAERAKANLADKVRLNLDRFVTDHPGWAAAVNDAAARSPPRQEAQRLAADLLPMLAASAAGDSGLSSARKRAETTAALAYRMEVRLAAFLRLETLLTTLAARVQLAMHGSVAEKRAYEGLAACERLRLPIPTPAGPPPAEPFPAFDEDLLLASSILPEAGSFAVDAGPAHPAADAGTDATPDAAVPVSPPPAVVAYRGPPPPAFGHGQSYLLFFWATWCRPCKTALPELLAFERDHGTPVLAVTDERPDVLDGFFRGFGRAFPERVLLDQSRELAARYAITGYPTFVFVPGSGAAPTRIVGYNPARGLGIDGWSWMRIVPVYRPGNRRVGRALSR